MIKHKTLIIALLSAIFALSFVGRVGAYDIIPKPQIMFVSEGKFYRLFDGMTIAYENDTKPLAKYMENVLSQSTGYDFCLKKNAEKGIVLRVDALKVPKAEGYILDINKKGAFVTGHDAAGLFYGIQTLLQLLPKEIYSSKLHKHMDWTLPQTHIEDAPEQPWRGMMLDVARYFYDIDFVKDFVDMMAMYKLNKLQFHLIDDSGWRIEIKKYPRLTEVGAWAQTGTHPMGGFYTQDQMRDLIEYAQLRGVEIIPEIEFPAHMLSAVVAYPWLSCSEIQHQVPLQHFISRDLLCLGKESSYKFLEDVLEEICELFPSPYINIGGDEAVYTQWEKCPLCQKVLKEQGLSKTSDLQGYLTNIVADMMAKKGKTVTGWEEVLLRGEVRQPLVGMFWHEISDTVKIAGTPHKAVLIPATHLYFDFPESATPGEVKGASWMPPISLEKVYTMPVPDYKESSCVMGVEACFWSDQFIHGTMLQEIPYLNENRSENYAEYFVFPRLIAFSEVAWTSAEDRNYPDFRNRMKSHYLRLISKGCNFRVPEPIVTGLEEKCGKYTFTLETPVEGAEIRYTTNGTYPTIHSARYSEPVTVMDKNDFRAATFINSRHFSLPLYYEPDYSGFESYGKYVASWKPENIHSDGSVWRFDCSGKITGNGSYTLSFIPVSDDESNSALSSLRLKSVKLFKRGELLSEPAVESYVVTDSAISCLLQVDQFEAGTPISVEAVLQSADNSEISGRVFVKKL